MKIVKKFLAIALCLTMLLGIIPFGMVGAGAVNESNVKASIDAIKKEYPDGAYFSANGKRCEHGAPYKVLPNYTVCYNCELHNILAARKKAGKVDKGNFTGGECRTCAAFASYVFTKCFGTPYAPGSASNNYFKTIGKVKTTDENGLKALFKKAKIGDIVQFDYGHWAVFISCNSKGVTLYDANSKNGNNDFNHGYTGQIREGERTYKWFGTTDFNYIYVDHATNYDTTNNYAATPTKITTNVVNGVNVQLRSSTSGRTIYYTLDGSTPTSNGSNKNTIKYDDTKDLIALTKTTTIKAIASKSGLLDSSVASFTITINKVATPKIKETVSANGFNIEINAQSGAAVYYTTDGSIPTVNSAKYTAGFTISENATVKAIAVKSGCANSDVASLSLTASVPAAPQLKLKSFDTTIGIGDTVELSWNVVEGAASYKLIVSGAESEEIELGNVTVASYIADKSGTYSFSVKAANFKGESTASSPAVKVTVKPDVTVTFEANKSTYATQKIRYNSSAAKPADPTMTGYTFDGWDKSFSNVTSDMTVTAKFIENKYTVKFLDEAGKVIGEPQSVEYGKSAVEPDAPTKNGYVFRGWTLANDSSENGTSYIKVDGNASFKPVFTWADPDLPLAVSINSAVRSDDSRSYAVSIKVTNSKAQDFNASAIAVIKTANDKVVATEVATITIPANANSKAYDLTITSNESAMLCEVYIVNKDTTNAELTGGALSAKASKAVTKNASATIQEWSEWSDWSTQSATKTETRDVETKTQYSYKDKTTATSYNSTMDGYTKVGEQWVDQGNTTVYYVKEWPANTGKKDSKYGYMDFDTNHELYKKYNNQSKVKTSANNTDSIKYEQVSEKVYSYLYWHYCFSHNNGVSDYFISDTRGEVAGGHTYSNFHAFESKTRLSGKNVTGGYLYKKSDSSKCPNTWWWTGGKFAANKDLIVYENVFKTYKKQYTFEKWSNSSEWSDIKPVASASREISTRTLYRYRTLEDKTTTASTEYIATENTSGTSYSVSGNIANLSKVFSGQKATVMVYRTKITDSTASQLEYVGQITLGSNNSYNISFIPKDELSDKTGDFIVSLGIASADKVFDVKTIEAPKQKFKVDFLDLDGKVISTQNIEYGKDAAAPALPLKEGYIVTWDKAYTYIHENTTIKAKKTAITYPVVFVDWANNDIFPIQNIEYGSTPRFPANPTAEGKIFKGWSLDSGSKITETTVIEAIYDDVTFTVNFLNKDGSVFETQTVPYGGYASVPENDPTADGFEFVAWDSGTAWWNIKANATVNPVFIYDKTVETPTIETTENEYLTYTGVNLETTTDDAEIRFTLDGSEPTGESELFSGIIFIEESTLFKAKAFKSNMNDSSTAEIFIDIPSSEEIHSSIPTVSVYTKDNYKVEDTTANICLAIINPDSYPIVSYGYVITNEDETFSEYNKALDTPLVVSSQGISFPIKNLTPGTTYSYYFYVEFDGYGLVGSGESTFTTLGEKPVNPGDDDPDEPVVPTGYSVKIKTPSTTTVKYGYTLVLHAEVEGTLPEGAKVVWKETSGDAFKTTANGLTAKATSDVKGEKTITVCVEGADGNVLKNENGEAIQDSVTLTAKVSFFTKFAYFFKHLFGANLTIDA